MLKSALFFSVNGWMGIFWDRKNALNSSDLDVCSCWNWVKKRRFSPVRIGEIAVCTCTVNFCRHLNTSFFFLEKLIWPKIAILLYAMGKYLAKMSKFIIKLTTAKCEKLPYQMGKPFDRIEKTTLWFWANYGTYEEVLAQMPLVMTKGSFHLHSR